MATPLNCFDPDNPHRSARHAKIYAAYELAYTLVDFSAAALFLVGSYMFFYKSVFDPAVWMFVFGSAMLGLKPTLRLTREIHLWRLGNVDELSTRIKEELK